MEAIWMVFFGEGFCGLGSFVSIRLIAFFFFKEGGDVSALTLFLKNKKWIGASLSSEVAIKNCGLPDKLLSISRTANNSTDIFLW